MTDDGRDIKDITIWGSCSNLAVSVRENDNQVHKILKDIKVSALFNYIITLPDQASLMTAAHQSSLFSF